MNISESSSKFKSGDLRAFSWYSSFWKAVTLLFDVHE